MFARLTSYQAAAILPKGDFTESGSEVVRAFRSVPGFRGIYYLIDRSTGDFKTLTLWEDEEAMRAGEERSAEIREAVTLREGERTMVVERFEVGFVHLET